MLDTRVTTLASLLTTAYEIFMAPTLATTALPFLQCESAAPSWTNQVKQER